MAELAQPNLLDNNIEKNKVAKTIADRMSQELVIALVGPVASGVSTAAVFLKETLIHNFGYDVPEVIKPSDVIRVEAHRVGIVCPGRKPLDAYVDAMQTAGNKLREKYGPNYLSEKVIEKIVTYRRDKGGYGGEDGQVIVPGRRAYIIDSIKNIEELDLLRQVYGETILLFGVFAPDEMRKKRLIDDGADPHEVPKIVSRDQGEVATFGQMTRKIFTEADFFICNDQKKEELRRKLERYLNLIFDAGIHTPTRDESAMYEACAAASGSACMSRQVGAAIVSQSGELISVGWNDVPKFGGGLYRENDQAVWNSEKKQLLDKDHRCFKYKKHECHNEIRRKSIIDGVASRLMSSGVLKKGTKIGEIYEVLRGTPVDALTEYSRSIHAEMEAILAVAREGRHSLVGATLYASTYPCHNCARHIVAAGIQKVIYVEPYLKSLATSLHDDSVTEDPNDTDRVVFSQYDGVAPRNFLRLFRTKSDRKRDGVLWRPPVKAALPVFRIPLDGPVDYEAKVIAELVSKEQDAGG